MRQNILRDCMNTIPRMGDPQLPPFLLLSWRTSHTHFGSGASAEKAARSRDEEAKGGAP
jgi:hypothetical protein